MNEADRPIDLSGVRFVEDLGCVGDDRRCRDVADPEADGAVQLEDLEYPPVFGFPDRQRRRIGVPFGELITILDESEGYAFRVFAPLEFPAGERSEFPSTA